MRTHVRDRDLGSGQRTNLSARSRKRWRLGFTLPEAAMSMAVFLVVASIVSLAVARTTTAQGAVRDERAVTSQLSSALEEVAASDFSALLTNNFIRPKACESDASLSCFTLGERDFEVLWQVDLGNDTAGNSLDAASEITLTASTSLPGGREVSASKVVAAPVAGWRNGAGVVQVSNFGSHYSGPIFLIGGSESAEVLDSRVFGSADSLLLRADPALCTLNSPCKIALNEKGEALTDEHTFSVNDVKPGARDVVLSANALSSAAVRISERSSLKLDLKAGSDPNSPEGTPQLNSVCLWWSVEDVENPSCNSTNATTLSISTLNVYGTVVGLSQGDEVTLRTDPESGKCIQAPGQVGFLAGAWAEAAVCTSWTWGRPSTLTVGESEGGFENAQIELNEPIVQASVLWDGDQARPAAGYSDQETWSKPRDMESCSLDSTCVSRSEVNENQLCPSGHCLSSANFLPRSNLKVPYFKVSSNTNFNLDLRDDDAETFGVWLDSNPAVGELRLNGNPVQVGEELAQFAGSGSLAFTYLGPSTVNTSFSLKVVDSRGERLIPVTLSDKTYLQAVELETADITQEESGAITGILRGSGGVPLADAAFDWNLPAEFGVDSTGSATTDSDGHFEIKVSPTRIASGEHTFNLAAGGVTLPATLHVNQRVSALEISSDATTATIRVLDAVGTPVPGTLILAAAKGAEGPRRGVYTSKAACTSDASGSCSVGVISEAGATASGVRLNASYKNLSAAKELEGGS